ncbi:MAG TPA: aldo/keto reductase [Anaerolineae bacterium]|nr:aldo/keto reductase [Anaerolineae bacterium]
MRYRTFGRTGWQVSDMGYGMWGMGGWTGSDDEESMQSLHHAVGLGCNFFDTAWAYGDGHSENLLGQLVRAYPDKRLYTATKIPPKNLKWPAKPDYTLDETYPPDHIREYTEKSLRNLGLNSVDLQQFHVWDDSWADDERWQRAVDDLKREGLIKAIGISINRWEPDNALRALRTGAVDAVQVIYNIFDQAPEDNLFPLCRELNLGVIARVPFDEGTLTGTLTLDSKWPEGDWRNSYFVAQNLKASVERAEALKPLIPAGMTLPELALRFILSNLDVSTIIPGMRKLKHVETNIAVSGQNGLPPDLLEKLRAHRWDRTPTWWSQ